MPESGTSVQSPSAVRPRRGWLNLVLAGCIFIVLAMAVATLVTFDKPHFGWMVGTWFLPVITGGVLAGAILVLVGTFKLPERKSWRGLVLILWALIALTSPLFGILFLLPWGVLLVMLPVVIAILVALYRGA